MNKVIGLAWLLLPVALSAQKFYPDDPLQKVPEPLPVAAAEERGLSDYFDLFLNTFGGPAEGHDDVEAGMIPAQAVTTLGEVPDSEWFTNRIGSRAMSIEEILKGPGDDRPPSPDGKWTIAAAKTDGVTPGFMIQDSTGERYLLKFDPLTNPEMASAADLLGTRFFHALGYNVPQNYIVHFLPDKLEIAEGATVLGENGKERQMVVSDIDKILERVPRTSGQPIRALASRFLPGRPMGGFRYHGTRSDDPNDITLHEHRRDLRGLYVFCSWLGHDDSRSINTLDTLVEENGKRFFRHHLIDFGSILGSASEKANGARSGNQYLFEAKPAFAQLLSLGLYTPRYYRHRYKKIPSVGLFAHEVYRPDQWRPEYPNPAFKNRLPDDTYWAAKKVMAFSDEMIRKIVELAQYSDPQAAAWVVECLIERRDKVGREYFSRVLPLDDFRVEGDRLAFTDLGAKYGFSKTPELAISWSKFDNRSAAHEPIEGAGAALPASIGGAGAGEYFAAKMVGDQAAKTVTVYLRKQAAGLEVVGIDRSW